MYITSISPSAYNLAEECLMKYFMSYLLRIREPGNVKTEIGTIIHSVYEVLALHKKAQQDGSDTIKHEAFGIIPAEDPMKVDVDKVWETCWDHFTKLTQNPKGVEGFTGAFKKEYKTYMESVFGTANDPRTLNILEVEKNIQFPIKENWAKYTYWSEARKKKVSGYYKINAILDLIVENPDKSIKVIDWKGLALDTKIPTPDGWTTMGELSVGDTIFDGKGFPTKVLGKSEIKERDCFEITFCDNNTVVCDDEHLWQIESGDVLPITKLKVGHKINVGGPLRPKESKLPINPYIFGIWLGDAKNRSFNLDRELLQLGVYNRKRIPKIYLRASISQRLELLKGLMDCDAHTCSNALQDDINELLLSLGQKERPSNKLPLPKKVTKGGTRTIKKIEKIAPRQTQCIKVASSLKTFLCTKGFIPTHNSGQRKNWITGKKKEYKDLQEDIQLNIYYYVMTNLYPNRDITTTVVYLQDGGPYDLVLTPQDAKKTITKVREKMELVRDIVEPSQTKSYRCKKWCYFGTRKFDDAPKEFRKGQFDDIGEPMCMCSHIHMLIKELGITEAIRRYRVPYSGDKG